MGLLRRLLGGSGRSDVATEVAIDEGDADERDRELQILREDQERMDELTRRQLRFADYAWQPPAEGGEQRAEDNDTADTGSRP